MAQNLAQNGQTGDLFGASVAYDGDNIVIGAPNGTTQGQLTGYAQAFTDPDRLFKGGFER